MNEKASIADFASAGVLMGQAANVSVAEVMGMLSAAARQMFRAKPSRIVGYGHRGKWNR